MLLYHILNLFFTILILVLLVRYFVERYQFYGFGPILISVIQITERVIRPLKQVLPRGALTLQDHTPLIAIFLTLVIRGVVLWGLFHTSLGPYEFSGTFYPFPVDASFTSAMAASFTLGLLLISETLIAFLFASVMLTRRGITMAGNAGFLCFQEHTFAIFRLAQKAVKTDNLTVLFLTSSVAILFASSLASVFTSLSFLEYHFIGFAFLNAVFFMLRALLNTYLLVLILAILASWIGADQYSAVVQIVRAMADPYLQLFRRWFPWARIDFIDLSPIFAFLFLTPICTSILAQMQTILAQWIAPSI